ncbi:hypothetical protein Q3G72_030694 [Acer saccharum]|nr:hypothetical protein Q3G72_030694 [Acer saccharum]
MVNITGFYPFNPHQLQRVTAGLPEPNQTENELSALLTEQENHENLQGMPSMAQLKEAIFGVDPVEVVRGDPQVDLEKVIEHDLLDSPSRDNSFAPSLIPNEEEARLSLEISESQPPMEVEDQATNPPPASHSSPADTEELHFDEEDHSLNNLPVIQLIPLWRPAPR